MEHAPTINSIFLHPDLDDDWLDPASFRVLAHITRRAGGGACIASQQNMAEVCGVSRSTVQRAMRELEASGYIETKARTEDDGFQTTNAVTVTPRWRDKLYVGSAIDDAGLGVDEFRLLFHLRRHADQTGVVQRSQRRMATACRVAAPRIGGLLSDLETKGLLKRESARSAGRRREADRITLAGHLLSPDKLPVAPVGAVRPNRNRVAAIAAGQRLRELLHRRKMTQTELAKELGVDPSYVSHMVNGKLNWLKSEYYPRITQSLEVVEADFNDLPVTRQRYIAPPPSEIAPRPSRDETGMELARVWASRSTDPKHKVGCVIQSDKSFLSISSGYNGRYPGCPTEDRVSDAQHESEFIHSEASALMLASGRWVEGEGGVIYCTHEPCGDCALLILAARRITRVVYETPYVPAKGRRGSVILREAGVIVDQVPAPRGG